MYSYNVHLPTLQERSHFIRNNVHLPTLQNQRSHYFISDRTMLFQMLLWV
ncbi:hypothetical protein [Moorena sp. SIO3B2]|nr:hypothetical protein [Moorena sp. SIO3B2]NEP36551.1 hypothetical protein [Moorena sp. SIO3B2]